jgi:hypothetical protein
MVLDFLISSRCIFNKLTPSARITRHTRCGNKMEKEKHKCQNEFCDSKSEVTFAPDPFDEEINGNDTPVWECQDCREQSADDI